MSVKPTPLLGGESVYCINEVQLEEAVRLVEKDPESAPRLQRLLKMIENDCTRNEQAALAFMLINRLRSTKA